MRTLREQAAIAALPVVIPFAQACVSPMQMAAEWTLGYVDALINELAKSAPNLPAGKDPKVCTPMERELLTRLDQAFKPGCVVNPGAVFDIAWSSLLEIRAEADALAKQEAGQ